MGTPVPSRTQDLNEYSDAHHGQRRGVQPQQSDEVPPEEQAHRAQISLPTSASTEGSAQNTDYPRQREPSGYLNETLANEYDQELENALDGIEWEGLENWLNQMEEPWEYGIREYKKYSRPGDLT